MQAERGTKTATKMKEIVKKKWLLYCCATCITCAISSCSTTARISIKQSQGEQNQETLLESDVKFKELTLNLNSTYFR